MRTNNPDIHESTPDELRREIDHTRSEISRDISEIQHRLSPETLKQRAREAIRERIQRARVVVMEQARIAQSRAGEALSRVRSTSREAGQAVSRRPYLAGSIAAAAGLALALFLGRSRRQDRREFRSC